MSVSPASDAPNGYDPHDPDDPAFLRAMEGLPPEVPDDQVVAYVRARREETEAGRAHETAQLRTQDLARALGILSPALSPVRSPVTGSKGAVSDERPAGAVSIGSLAEPPPREWAVAGVVPEGAPTILAGHSGLGKSYLALLLAVCVCTGRPFLGREVRKGNVLWVDRELDQDETARRAYAVARGLGLEKPPTNLYYVRPAHPIGTAEAQAAVMEAIAAHDIGLTILDSLTLGATGDASAQQDVVAVMRRVEAWGSSLLIDHITKGAAASNHSSATIFGSAMKRAMARSTLLLTPAGDGLALRPDKSNFGPASAPLFLVARHRKADQGAAEVVFERVAEGDEALAGAEDHAPAQEQTFHVLCRLHRETGAPVPLAALAEERDVKDRTVRNHISRLGPRVLRHGDNTYTPADALVGIAEEGTVDVAGDGAVQGVPEPADLSHEVDSPIPIL